MLVESHSALFDFWIDAPISYTPSGWRNADGHINQFPLTVTAEEVNSTGIYNLYAVNETAADEVYAYYTVDKTEFPYLVINPVNDSANSNKYHYLNVYFMKELPTDDGDIWGSGKQRIRLGSSSGWFTDITDINESLTIIKANNATLSDVTDFNNTGYHTPTTSGLGYCCFANFDTTPYGEYWINISEV